MPTAIRRQVDAARNGGLVLLYMARLGDAVLLATGAERINYEILGNVEPALHAHLIPRHTNESPERRTQPVWLHDWSAAEPYGGDAHERLRAGICAALEQNTT